MCEDIIFQNEKCHDMESLLRSFSFGMCFAKMHGLGNDFVILSKSSSNHHDIDSTRMIRDIASYRSGIGCDQLIVYEELKNGKLHNNDFLVRIYNKDGGVAKACGNAMRCLAKLIYLMTNETKLQFHVLDRVIKCEVQDIENIKVNMGKASFNEAWMPDIAAVWDIAKMYGIDPKEILCVDVGNPHLVIFSAISTSDQQIIGERLQTIGLFNDGINVNFASIIGDSEISLQVWERGTGFTMSCGSGACATFAAARALGFIKNDETKIRFEMGSLHMSICEDEILMRGAATLVAIGKLYNGK